MIQVHGSGIAALAATKAIANRGLPVEQCVVPQCKPKPLVVLLSLETLGLIADIFDTPPLYDLGYPVERRIVCKPGQTPIAVTAPAFAVRLGDLVARLTQEAACARQQKKSAPASQYQIDATGKQARLARQWADQDHRTFGQRVVIAAELPCSMVDSVMEMTDQGWLFSFPIMADRTVVQMMTARPPADPKDAILKAIARTEILRRHVDGNDIIRLAIFDAAPRILPRMATGDWLAVGQAAFSMDPVCGDGVGAGLRSALLAAATLSKVMSDQDQGAITHFQNRHVRSFAQHLRHVADYYQPLTRHPDWALELRSTYRFLTGEAPGRIVDQAAMRYALKDGRLVAAE